MRLSSYLFRLGLVLFFNSGLVFVSKTLAQATQYWHCSNNPARAWWDVVSYQLSVDFTDTTNGNIKGENIITAKVIDSPYRLLQIDLDTPLKIQAVIYRDEKLSWYQEKGAYFVSLNTKQTKPLHIGDTFSLRIIYQGRPIDAKNPPWNGGFVRTHDSSGTFWQAVACQGSGASLWFPCKNFQGDEPDSVSLFYTVSTNLKAIGNGRLIQKKISKDNNSKTFVWKVLNPINNYDITFYIGDYVHWSDSYYGLKGNLDLDFYVLRGHKDKAKKQFSVVKPMLACFEDHFGPYPFYKDGYKLVEAPYLGMEHQSAIAYGNHFKMGYLGQDRSKTGVGLLFDFIIIHESAHEWFGNSITTEDKADSWVHEGFASYAETIFAECIAGREKAFEYQCGKRRTIRNDKPVEGHFNQCDEGSSDAYDKASFLLHTIRLMMESDSAFFNMIKAMNARYGHQIVSGHALEQFIIDYSGLKLSKIFNQYLRSARLPVLKFTKDKKGSIWYHWANCAAGFNMPVLYQTKEQWHWLYPTIKPKRLEDKLLVQANQINRNFLIEIDWY